MSELFWKGQTMDVDSPTLSPEMPLLAGRYRLVEQLGAGGMGTVYLARDTKLDRPVAIKMMPEHVRSGDSVARFRREALALARLSHPGIVQAFDHGEHDGRPFIVMEYVQGKSLSAAVAGGPLPPGKAADVCYQAAVALHHAHAQGLVHRDVKPSNLFLTSEGRVKLLDLGLARFLQDHLPDAGLTREGAGMGTPDYAAPEQFADARKADARSDVYALGCTLYHLLSGRVPFPGSSMSEKLKAHERQPPPPLEELCPDAPVGLVLAVGRMMAKAPTERFQTAREAADALAPYLAGGSATVADFRKTHTWEGAGLVPRGGGPRRPVLPWLVAAAAILLAALIPLAGGWWRGKPGEPSPENGTTPQPEALALVKPPPAPDLDAPGAAKVVAVVPGEAVADADPDLLTVSKDAKDGGKYRTIGEALADVKPGQTVRVLDGASYTDAIQLNRPTHQKGITLEAVRGAILSVPGSVKIGIQIIDVPGVTIRGFRLKTDDSQTALIVLGGRCGGTVLEDLELTKPPFNHRTEKEPCATIAVEMVKTEGNEAVTVRRCRVTGGDQGVHLIEGDNGEACEGVRLADNSFRDMRRAVLIEGDVRRVLVAGNVIQGCTLAGLHVVNLKPTAREVRVANNTFLDCHEAVVLYGKPDGNELRFVNNLILGSARHDVVHFIGVPDPPTREVKDVPAEGKKAHDWWSFAHNWREAAAPPNTDGANKGWIPPSATDVRKDAIDGVGRDPRDAANFLRPAKGSPLAARGADTAALPAYVGARPPVGIDPWDWDRAWRVPADAKVLTVSKEEKGGGKYRTISDALKNARPWYTIRVLDAAEYEESVTLDRKADHEGISVEAPAGATLVFGPTPRRAVAIEGVPWARVAGFRLTAAKEAPGRRRAFVVVTGEAAGVTLDRLTIQTRFPLVAIALQSAAGTADDPILVRRCHAQVDAASAEDGILITGNPELGPSRNIRLLDNRVVRFRRGVWLAGSLERVQVAGNLAIDCTQTGLQVENLTEDSTGIRFVNNTATECREGFRVHASKPSWRPKAGQVELLNNLWLEAINADLAFSVDSETGFMLPGEVDVVRRAWRIRHNFRDFSGDEAAYRLPRTDDDRKVDRADLLPEKDRSARVLPARSSAVATGGAGKDVPSLPPYAGALPPEGVEAWNWDRAWRKGRRE